MKTILIVDDDEAVIMVLKQFLERMEYNVLIAQRGEEAVDIYSDTGSLIDLVILDLSMPGLSGSETFDRLKEINPEVKVILTSGSDIDMEAIDIINRGYQGFIQKPFQLEELVDVIKDNC